MGNIMGSDELMSPPHLKDVLKTLEYFGIYQRFECIKCHQNLSTINFALAHLRGEYLECKKGSVSKTTPSSDGAQKAQRVGEKEVFAPRTPNKHKLVSPKNAKKEVPSSSIKHKSPGRERRERRSRYSLKQIEMILNKKKKDTVFAKQFKISTRDVAKLRYNWKKTHTYDNLLISKEVVEVPKKKDIVAVTRHVTSKKPHVHPYKINKSAKGSQDYKVESADEVL